MSSQEIRYDIAEQTARLTIDRPSARNAVAPQTIRELLGALDRAEGDSAAKVVVLTGAGDKVFCPGYDLSAMGGSGGALESHELRRLYGQLLLRLCHFPKPTVARVNGHALAGGLGLVLACDLAVAADDAQLGTPEIDRGLFPFMVMALLQRHVGRKWAYELSLLGDRIGAAEAMRMGIVNRSVPRVDLDGATSAMVAKLAEKSPAVLKLGKRATMSAEGLPLLPAMELLAGQLSLNAAAEDAAEGIAAFAQKRKPVWKGR